MWNFLRFLPVFSLLLVLLAACAPGTGILSASNWQSAGLSRQHIRTFTVDPNNAQNVYAGDAQDGIFASTDGGSHWTHKSVGVPTGINALDFNDSGKTLYAATSTGVFSSANEASSWTAVSGLPKDAYTAIAFDLKTPQSIFVGSQHSGVLLSRDGGLSWSAIDSGLPSAQINKLIYNSDARALWAATNQGVYRTNNNGASWQALNVGLPANTVAYDVLPASISGGSAGLVFAGTNQGFYLSQDDGAHWTTSQTPLIHVSILAVLIDVQNPRLVYIATDKAGVLRSTDNGQNWGSTASGLTRGQPVYALAEGATNYGQLFAASNDVYLFPGNNSVFDPSRIFPLLLAVIFFYLLYRLSMRGRKSRRDLFKPERIDS